LEFSINLTIEDILNKEIEEYIYDMLRTYNIGPRVVFEIVESESIENFKEVLDFIKKIKKFGSKIAIDDFGTGYSNFIYLMKLNTDYIKIDGSLIKEINTNKQARVVVTIIVDFAKKMGIKTVAEFVETQEIQNKVLELGIDYSQGYFFSEPKIDILN
ncbi:MAG: EAL domain-containing protein, partial [Sulfurimonas sp.]